MTRKWYVQINDDHPQKLAPCNPQWSNGKITEWKYTVSRPKRLRIFYLFSTKDNFKHSYDITVRVGSLPVFHLGLLGGTRTALQSEPNFQIQANTKCEIIVRKNRNSSKNRNVNKCKQETATMSPKLYCLCQQPWVEGVEMIGCNICEDGWYHPQCLNMTHTDYQNAVRNDQWKCPKCAKNTIRSKWNFDD